MSIIEFIGFIITMVAMSLLFIKRVKEERRYRDHPDEELPPIDPMQQLLMPTKQRSPEKEALTREPSFQSQLEKHQLNSELVGFLQERAIDSRKLSSTLDDRYTENVYEVHRRETKSYGVKMVDRLQSRRDMMICHEILSRPKGW